jgi:hypothetical protein
MPSAPTFSIQLDTDDPTLLNDFRRFLDKRGLDLNEVSSLVDEFSKSALPQLGRIRALSNNGSIVDFTRSFDTSTGKIKVELNTTPKTIFAQLASIFGRKR